MEKEATFFLYRVQGGIMPNRSRKCIPVNEDGTLDISVKKKIYVGDKEHNTHFLKRRLGLGDKDELSRKKNIDFSDKEVSVVRMEFPMWIKYLIDSNIKQHGNGINSNANFPFKVDITTPGESYEFGRNWINLLNKTCLGFVETPIESSADFIDFTTNEQDNHSTKLQSELNNEDVIDALVRCEIKVAHISDINSEFNAGINMQEYSNATEEFLERQNAYMQNKYIRRDE